MTLNAIPPATEPHVIDKRATRTSFSRAATGYDHAAVLQREVGDRMAERLDYIRIEPSRLLDAGSGTGHGTLALAARYAKAQRVALDIAPTMLHAALAKEPARWRSLLGGRPRTLPVCGDLERLPLAAASMDMVWSNLALQWVNDLPGALGEFARVTRPGGLVMFSTFGPDTLKELRGAFAEVDGYSHVSRFTDMHDIGDMLLEAGFVTPVVDMERITLTYASLPELMRDLKAIGAHNATAGRRQGMMGRQAFARVVAAYERFRTAAGRLPATYEVVYGHAWRGEPRRAADGRAVIRFERARSGGGDVR
jgi:malonyl-CoA O-methyltransferase